MPWAGALVITILAWLVLSHAWFSDDAYFSFRSIDNFVNGYGLTWNVQERVQAYTHPLWVLLLSAFYFFTREIYLTTIFVSAAITLLLAWLIIFKLAANPWQGVATVLLLSLSTTFIDYSTSGLENPLSHLLMVIFVTLWLRRSESPNKLAWLSLTAALASVNRLDTLLFYLPPLIYEWWQQKDRFRALGQMALGFLPLAAWETFSLIYYGFPFPNTYYAKAQNYVPLIQEIWAGLNYFFFTLMFDPITWVVILTAIIVVIWLRQPRGIALAAGILLYLVYILQVGGDFMGGRFLSTAFLASALLISFYVFPRLELRRAWPLIPAALLISALAASPPYFLYAKNFRTAEWMGVVDERMVYYTTNFLRIEDLHRFNSDPQYNALNKIAFLVRSLLRGTAFRTEAEHDWVDLGRELRTQAEKQGKLYLPQGANGFTGYYAGPDVYIAHGLAITDGFLARVPPIYNPNWRSGHFMRIIPAGYLEVEAGNQESLDDPILDAYFQEIRLVTQGPLFSAERWQAIWELNTRDFEDWLPGYSTRFRFPGMQTISLSSLPESESSLTIDLEFTRAAQIEFPQPVHPDVISLGLSAGDSFDLVYIDSTGREIGSQQIRSALADGVELHTINAPDKVSTQGFTTLRLIPIRVFNQPADGDYLLSTLELGE